MAARKRRILFVAQLVPPSPLVAARRAQGLVKYLSRAGFDVTVLTSDISGEGEIEGASRVIRTTDLMASRVNWRRSHFKALTGESPGTYGKPSRLEAMLIPDVAAATWLPSVAIRIPGLRGEGFECVISSSPPASAHLAGLLLGRRGIPWIAEFRDGWLYDRLREWPLIWQRRLDAALERKVVLGADAVVGVTKPIADDLQDRYGVPAEVITNGFDPEECAGLGADNGLLDPSRHSLVYTGRIAYSGLDPAPLVQALRLLRDIDRDAATKLEVVLAGPLLTEEQRQFAASDLRGMVRTVGSLDRADTLRIQRSADSLLVIANGKRERSVATGKLFEYLAARRPIVVVGDGSPAAHIVEDAGAGLTTSGSDSEAIAQTLLRLVEGDLPAVSEQVASEYSYPVIARRYSELIDRLSRR